MLTFDSHSAMDAIIRQTVRGELRRSNPTASQTISSTDSGESDQHERESTSAGSPRSTFSSRTVNRLSGLLNRIRHWSGRDSSNKKREFVNHRIQVKWLHRIQVKWLHYDERKEKFTSVRLKNGGGNRFIAYTDTEPLTLEDLTEKTCALFFPNGNNIFAGRLEEMNKWICDTTEGAILNFLVKEL